MVEINVIIFQKKKKKFDLIFLYIRYHVIYTPLYKLQSQVTSDKETNKKKIKYKKMFNLCIFN